MFPFCSHPIDTVNYIKRRIFYYHTYDISKLVYTLQSFGSFVKRIIIRYLVF
jgi:hypothetical protein